MGAGSPRAQEPARRGLTRRTSSSSDQLDIGAARRLLDKDHYGLERLKRRVLEYLAVRQLKASLKVLRSGSGSGSAPVLLRLL